MFKNKKILIVIGLILIVIASVAWVVMSQIHDKSLAETEWIYNCTSDSSIQEGMDQCTAASKKIHVYSNIHTAEECKKHNGSNLYGGIGGVIGCEVRE
jgi:hypothetical protein